MFDLTPSEARLFATLYIKGEPMTLDNMSDSLGKSKTSMSNAVRTLLDLGLVERVWKKGVRKDHYQADENLYRKFMSSYIQKWVDAVTRQKKALEDIYDSIDEEGNNTPLFVSLKEIIQFHSLIEQAFEEIDQT